MFNWFKKKTRRPLSERRAQGLEDLLNESEPQSAPAIDVQGRQSRPEAEGSEPIISVPMYLVMNHLTRICSCQEGKQCPLLELTEGLPVHPTRSTQTDSPPTSLMMQTLIRRTETPQGKVPLRAGRRYGMRPGEGLVDVGEVRTPQRENATSAGSSGKGTSECPHRYQYQDCLECYGQDNRTEYPPSLGQEA